MQAVTAVHNRRELTLACLSSLFASDLSAIELQVVVVDDGSSDGTAEAIQAAWPDATIVHGDGSLHYTAATNRGLALAAQRDADFVLSFNDDSLFPPDCLQRLVACARKYPRSVVGPLLLRWDAPERIFQVDPTWDTWYGGWRHGSCQTVHTVPTTPWSPSMVVGNCVLMPMSALREVGLMREDVLPVLGDGEHVVRMRRAGYMPVIEPSARLLCQPNATPRRLRDLSVAELWSALWADRFSRCNLRQHWWVNWFTAPSRRQAIVGSIAHVARLLLRAAGLLRGAADRDDEWPLIARVRVLAVDEARPKPLIWYAWQYIEWGGAQIYFLHLAAAARAQGYDVRAAMPRASQPGLVRLFSDAGIPIVLFDGQQDLSSDRGLARRLARRWRNAAAGRAMQGAIECVSSEAAVMHTDLAPWSASRTIARLLRRMPVVVTIHTALPTVPAWRQFLWQRALVRLDQQPRFCCIVSNEDARRSLAPFFSVERVASLPLTPSVVSAEEIEQARLIEPAARAKLEALLGLPSSQRRISVVGQFVERKGVSVLLDTLVRLRDRGAPVQCVWFGTAELTHEDRRQIDAHRLGELFHYLAAGQVGPSVRSYLQIIRPLSDIYVLPSLVEGLPSAVVEAMSLGLPIVASRINAIPDALCHGETGWLVPPQDAEALADAIDHLFADADLRRRLGDAARVDALKHYERHAAARPTLVAYGRLLATQEAHA